MEIEIPYETARSRHPAEVLEILAKLRKGTSKHKNAAPEQLTWKYFWCVRIGCAGPKSQEIQASLMGKIGRWVGVDSNRNFGIPPEIASWAKERQKDREAAEIEKAAFEALPEEEKARQRKELIEKFRAGGGVVITIGAK